MYQRMIPKRTSWDETRQMVLDVHDSNCIFECRGGFIIYGMKYWIESTDFEVYGKFSEGMYNLIFVPVIHWSRHYLIAIIYIHKIYVYIPLI